MATSATGAAVSGAASALRSAAASTSVAATSVSGAAKSAGSWLSASISSSTAGMPAVAASVDVSACGAATTTAPFWIAVFDAMKNEDHAAIRARNNNNSPVRIKPRYRGLRRSFDDAKVPPGLVSDLRASAVTGAATLACDADLRLRDPGMLGAVTNAVLGFCAPAFANSLSALKVALSPGIADRKGAAFAATSPPTLGRDSGGGADFAPVVSGRSVPP